MYRSMREEKKQVLFEKILGCLIMVAVGDALGMPAHDMTIDEIRERFGGPIRDLKSPFKDSRVHRGMKAGQITDDAGLTFQIARAYIENRGKITPSLIGKYVADWVNEATSKGLSSMIGGSTKQAVQRINDGLDPVRESRKDKNPMMGATNGGAMKISPAGLIHPGNIEGAIRDAVSICLPTHGTQTAISAACAIAAGVSEAMRPQATVFSVAKATLAGAIKGETLGGKKGRIVPLPSVPERIKLAIAMALKTEHIEEANRLFSSVIGTGLAAYESIPTAIGIFVACEGDPRQCLIAGANVGYDTDTIASMAGALSGTLKGLNHVPKDWYRTVKRVNGLNLISMAKELVTLSLRNC
jgi:ADP-ribosylglycohydrolase